MSKTPAALQDEKTTRKNFEAVTRMKNKMAKGKQLEETAESYASEAVAAMLEAIRKDSRELSKSDVRNISTAALAALAQLAMNSK